MTTTMQTITPDGRAVEMATIDIVFGGGEPETVTVIIDDALSDHGIPDGDAWEDFDADVFYYMSRDEWERLNRGESIMEWKLIQEK